MISVEAVIQELRRADAEASECTWQCGLCCSEVEGIMNSLSVFGREGQMGLSAAANYLNQAQSALDQLRSSIASTISNLSK